MSKIRHWRNWPYWLKGLFMALIVNALLASVVISLGLKCIPKTVEWGSDYQVIAPRPWYCAMQYLSILPYLYPTFLVGGMTAWWIFGDTMANTAEFYVKAIIFSFIFAGVIGVLIGWIVGKVKSKKLRQ